VALPEQLVLKERPVILAQTVLAALAGLVVLLEQLVLKELQEMQVQMA